MGGTPSGPGRREPCLSPDLVAVTRGHLLGRCLQMRDFSVLYFGRFSSVGVTGCWAVPFRKQMGREPRLLCLGSRLSCLGEAVVSQEGCPSIKPSTSPLGEVKPWQHQSQLAVVPEPAKN